MRNVKLFAGGLLSFLMVFAFASASYGSEGIPYSMNFHVEPIGDGEGRLTAVVSYDHDKVKQYFRVDSEELIETVIELQPSQDLEIDQKYHQVLIDKKDPNKLLNVSEPATNMQATRNGAFLIICEVLFINNGRIVDKKNRLIYLAAESGAFRIVERQEWKKIAFPKNTAPVTKEQMMKNLDEGDIPGEGIRGPHEPKTGLRCGDDCHDGGVFK